MLASFIVFIINVFRALANLWRKLWRRRVDYVRIDLSSALPEFAAAPPWWQRRLTGRDTPPSLQALRRQLERIAADPQTKGILLYVNGFAAGWATLQSLRNELLHFRASGKRVVAYVLTPDTAGYCVACAADEILAPPTATFQVLGVRSEIQFLKDALAKVGIQAEVESVSPYKSAGETFIRSDISPENREQLQRILDERYDTLVQIIAEGRRLAPEQVRALIDDAPFHGEQARAHGLFDALRYEDQLETHLQQGEQKPRILAWNDAKKALRVQRARRHRKIVAVVPVEGMIMMGQNRNVPIPLPFIGGQQAGAEGFAQALRQAESNPRVAAVIVYVNSGGGDAFASDLMWREVLRIRHSKPVVVAMGDVAASGGYYLAAPASAIVAQPGTLTGSIGVVSMRPVAAELFQRAGINTVVLQHGAHSGLFSVSTAPTDDERAVLRRFIMSTYDDFKRRVREGRNMSEEQLEPIAGGRVWTGRSALEHRLVDELGGIPEALMRAQALAGLPQDRTAPLVLVRGGRESLPPQPFPSPQEPLAAWWRTAQTALHTRVWMILPFEGL